MPRLAVLLLALPQILALRTPVVKAPGSRCSRKSIVHAAGLSLFAPGLSLFAPALPANAVEMYSTASSCTAGAICSGSGKTMLAAYDEMLLKRTSEELCVKRVRTVHLRCERAPVLTRPGAWFSRVQERDERGCSSGPGGPVQGVQEIGVAHPGARLEVP